MDIEKIDNLYEIVKDERPQGSFQTKRHTNTKAPPPL